MLTSVAIMNLDYNYYWAINYSYHELFYGIGASDEYMTVYCMGCEL